jgi:hypothetical protein
MGERRARGRRPAGAAAGRRGDAGVAEQVARAGEGCRTCDTGGSATLTADTGSGRLLGRRWRGSDGCHRTGYASEIVLPAAWETTAVPPWSAQLSRPEQPDAGRSGGSTTMPRFGIFISQDGIRVTGYSGRVDWQRPAAAAGSGRCR